MIKGLYRFRGATIRNILEFPQKFAKNECKIFPLVVNYRSESEIVDFYNKWMSDTSKNFFSWNKFRYDKKIEPHKKSALQSPSVIKISSNNNQTEWHQKIFDFIKNLKESGKIDDFNQIAFLFSSVKNQKVIQLASFLESHGINVYSPRSIFIQLQIFYRVLLSSRYIFCQKFQCCQEQAENFFQFQSKNIPHAAELQEKLHDE